MVPGDTLDATILDSTKDWALAWDHDLNPSGIVIAQRRDLDDDEPAKIKWLVEIIGRFFATQKPTSPGLLYVDEGMDFFGETGHSRYGNAIQRCFRAGGEKGMSCLLGLQRPKTVNLQTLTESNVLYLFHLRYEEDVKRLWEMGFPKGEASPRAKYHFRFFRDDYLHPKPVKLSV